MLTRKKFWNEKRCWKFYIPVAICLLIPINFGFHDTVSVWAGKPPIFGSGLEWAKTMSFVGAAVVHLKWFIDTCTEEENEGKRVRPCIDR